MSGYFGWCSTPVAAITTSTSSRVPGAVVEVPRPVENAQRVTASPKRTRSITPCSAATRSKYASISGPGENRWLQSGVSANEYEYRCDGTSHDRPGYVFSRHVPPTRSAFS